MAPIAPSLAQGSALKRTDPFLLGVVGDVLHDVPQANLVLDVIVENSSTRELERLVVIADDNERTWDFELSKQRLQDFQYLSEVALAFAAQQAIADVVGCVHTG